ncbi:MAG TPA: DUF3592 domain-containing protein [Caulobacteraceae bacterium]
MGGLVFLLGAAIVAAIWFFHLRAAKKASSSAGWPTAPGTIQASVVRENVETDADNNAETIFYSEVAYTYEVAGKVYTSTRIGYGASIRFQEAAPARAVCDRYPQGAAVQVRYDPANPAESVLESKKPSARTAIIFTVVVVVLTLIVGLALG